VKWSRLKKATEELLTPSLRGRIQYHITSYGPGESVIMTRVWITLDKQEILNFSSATWLKARHELMDNRIRTHINQLERIYP